MIEDDIRDAHDAADKAQTTADEALAKAEEALSLARTALASVGATALGPLSPGFVVTGLHADVVNWLRGLPVGSGVQDRDGDTYVKTDNADDPWQRNGWDNNTSGWVANYAPVTLTSVPEPEPTPTPAPTTWSVTTEQGDRHVSVRPYGATGVRIEVMAPGYSARGESAQFAFLTAHEAREMAATLNAIAGPPPPF